MARQVGVTACKIRIHPCENNGKSTEFDDGNKTKCFSHKDVVGNAPQEDTSSDRLHRDGRCRGAAAAPNHTKKFQKRTAKFRALFSQRGLRVKHLKTKTQLRSFELADRKVHPTRASQPEFLATHNDVDLEKNVKCVQWHKYSRKRGHQTT
mmetsp:Transcript_108359/g.183499  ORF Transcript_108359/g.183499 Transcript_108359/m.183499 type:complete len:151 (+) Transcript_108359:904-1356(+)